MFKSVFRDPLFFFRLSIVPGRPAELARGRKFSGESLSRNYRSDSFDALKTSKCAREAKLRGQILYLC